MSFKSISSIFASRSAMASTSSVRSRACSARSFQFRRRRLSRSTSRPGSPKLRRGCGCLPDRSLGKCALRHRNHGRLDSRPPNKHGGNIDNKELVAGTRLFLPVWVDEALFSTGDGHAAQGDGEINQTAIETSLDGHFRLSPRTDFTLDLPVAVTPEHLMTMAFHEDLDDAATIAMRSMINLLERFYGMAFHDAYRFCSVAADMRVTQFVNGNRGIHVLLARNLLTQLPCKLDLFANLAART